MMREGVDLNPLTASGAVIISIIVEMVAALSHVWYGLTKTEREKEKDMIIRVRETQDGKYFGIVRLHAKHNLKIVYETPEYLTCRLHAKHNLKIVHETPEYLTWDMAATDAKCWVAFHGQENDVTEQKNEQGEEFTIDADDKVYTRNGRVLTGTEFAAHIARITSRTTPVEFKVHPMTGRRGFHLDIVYPTGPARKFTIHKAC